MGRGQRRGRGQPHHQFTQRKKEKVILTGSVTETHKRCSHTSGGLSSSPLMCEIRFVLPRPQSVRTSCVRTHVGGKLFILECECNAEEGSVCYRLMSPSSEVG